MFRIVWISQISGATGHGEAVFTEQQALDMANSWNKAYPDCKHTIEKHEPALSLNVKGHRCSYGDLTFVAHPSPTASAEATPVASKTPVPSTSSSASVSAKAESPQPQ